MNMVLVTELIKSEWLVIMRVLLNRTTIVYIAEALNIGANRNLGLAKFSSERKSLTIPDTSSHDTEMIMTQRESGITLYQ